MATGTARRVGVHLPLPRGPPRAQDGYPRRIWDSENFWEKLTFYHFLSGAPNAEFLCLQTHRTEWKSVYRNQEVKDELLEMFLGANPETGEDYRIPISACCKLFSMKCIQRKLLLELLSQLLGLLLIVILNIYKMLFLRLFQLLMECCKNILLY